MVDPDGGLITIGFGGGGGGGGGMGSGGEVVFPAKGPIPPKTKDYNCM